MMGNNASSLSSDRSERSKALDQLGGWQRNPIKRGDSLDESLRLLQLGVHETKNSVGDLMDSSGGRARIDMQEATIAQLKKLISSSRIENAKRNSHHDIQAAKKRLEKEEQALRTMQMEEAQHAAESLQRRKSAKLPDDFHIDSTMKRMWVTEGNIEEVKAKEETALKRVPLYQGRKTVTKPVSGNTTPGRPAATRARRASIAMDEIPTMRKQLMPDMPVSKIVTQFDPEFFGFPAFTPTWRVNVARAKRTFRLAFIGMRAFQYRLKLKHKPISKLQRVPSFSVHVPMVLRGDLQRFAHEQIQVFQKHKKFHGIEDPKSPEKKASQTKTPGFSRLPSRSSANGGRRASTGSTSSLFSSRPGTVQSGTGMTTPASTVLESVVPTASELGEIANLGDLITAKDFDIPPDAMKNLQMMKLYCNRGNSKWTDEWEWSCGKAFDIDTFQRGGGLSYNHYKLSAIEKYKEGKIAFQVFDSDVMMGLRDGEQLPLWLQDPWDMVMDSLGEERMPLGDHFEGLTYFSRLLISLRIALDASAGLAASQKIKIILHLPTDYAAEIVQRMIADKFYGYPPDNVIFIPQSRFGGYSYDKKSNMFKQIEDSMRDSPGSGESMRQLMFVYEGFTMDTEGKKHTIEGSVLQTLTSSGVEWMRSMFIDDIIASHSDNVLDIPTLAMSLKSNESFDTNVVIQAVTAQNVNTVKRTGNVILHARKPGSPPSGAFSGDPGYNVWQVMMDDLESMKWMDTLDQLCGDSRADPMNCQFLTSTNRFFISLSNLQKSLTARNLFHVSLALQGPYVYPKLHMCDLTTGSSSNSVAFTTKLPATSSILDPEAFSEQLLPLLCQQDKWPLFQRNIGKWAGKTVSVVTRHSAVYKPAPRRFVMILTDNEVSRDAYDFFCGAFGSCMRSEDTLYLVTTGKSPQQPEELEAFLASFKDDAVDLQNVKRDVLMRNDRSLINVLEEYIEEKRPYMVILGTDGLSDLEKMKKQNGVLLGSISMTLAKQILYPVLIVKQSRACQLLRKADGSSEPIKVMFQADTTAQVTFEYLTTVLDKKRGDTVWFAKAWGRDNDGSETPSARSVLAYYTDMASDLGLKSQRKALEGAAATHIPPAAEHEHSHIVALHTGKAKALSDVTRDLLMKSPCAVLINKV